MANKKSTTKETTSTESTNYTVNVTPEFKTTATGADARVRSGITVSSVDGYTGPLTDAQLKEIEADPYLSVKKG